jgi:hypothetical protein
VSKGITIANDDPTNPVLPRISTVKINVSLFTSEAGAGAGDPARTSLSAIARIEQ